MKISKQRVEAFSDGVIAIIVTIMVLNIPLPNKFTIEDIMGLVNSIFVYFVSFFVVGSQWNKHRYLFDCFEEVSNKIIWRNLLYLFLLSLMPIFTKWVIQNPDEVVPVIGYDIVFILVNFSIQFMFNCIPNEKTRKFIDKGEPSWKHFIIMILAFGGIIVLSIFYPRVSIVLFIGVPVAFSILNLWVENHNHMDGR